MGYQRISAILIERTVVLLIVESFHQQDHHRHYVHQRASIVQMSSCFFLCFIDRFCLLFRSKRNVSPWEWFFSKWFYV